MKRADLSSRTENSVRLPGKAVEKYGTLPENLKMTDESKIPAESVKSRNSFKASAAERENSEDDEWKHMLLQIKDFELVKPVDRASNNFLFRPPNWHGYSDDTVDCVDEIQD
jgi:hypothetical protein